MSALAPSSALVDGLNRGATDPTRLHVGGLDTEAFSPAPTIATKSVFSEASLPETLATVPEIAAESQQSSGQRQLPADIKYDAKETRSSPDNHPQLQINTFGPASASDNHSTEAPLRTPSTKTRAPNGLALVPSDATVDDNPCQDARLGEIFHRLGELAHARDKLLLKQVALDSERQKATDAQERAEASQDALMLLLRNIFSTAGPNDIIHQASQLYERVERDLEEHKRQSQQVKHIESGFRDEEFNLLKMDKELVGHLRASFPNLPQPEHGVLDGTTLVSPPPHATPRILQAYWNALGEREHLWDEIFDLDQEHRFDAAEFERMQERMVAPPRSESEFEREYEHKRAELTRLLFDTNTKVEQLHMDCVLHGIDPNTSRKAPSMSSSAPSLPDVAHSDSGFYRRSLQFQGLEKPIARRSTDNLEELGVTARVESWLSGVGQPWKAPSSAQPG